MSETTINPAGHGMLRPLFAPLRAWRRHLYALTTLTGVAWFALAIATVTALSGTRLAALGVPAAVALAFALALPAAWLERRRQRLIGSTVPRRRRGLLRAVAHLLLSAPLGGIGLGLVVFWVLVSVRNLVLFPFVYSWAVDLSTSWGGPTQLGAVALHMAGGLAAFLLVPYLVGGLATLHAALTRRLLGPAE
ncbi:hypothetical protein Athai_65350 [Actinocatenispora thailandica]|uniref:Putative sensor domain-containing protein n=1 Tax=Actinocatenispora thailandica TaxID=227318 RepID=A0A7R7DX58_9ACTN|nr:sensor domain-containing protein [Actinocatenispora thailandica]BCJ39032.1 hypothetical protein Athai_65350 [Actinocatenispora thailandica]